MPWTTVSDATAPGWGAGDAAVTATYDALTRAAIAWGQLSVYTQADALGDVDFMLTANEQYPLLAVEDRPLYITETGFTTP